MKSYFAKLAARATLTNAPVSLPVSAPKPQGPSFERSGFVNPPIAHRVEQPAGLRQHSTDRAAHPSLLSSTENTAPHKSSHVATERSVDNRSESLLTHTQSSATEVRSTRTPREAPEIQSLEPRSVLPDSYRMRHDNQDPSLTEQNKVSLTKSRDASEETKKSEATRDGNVQEQASETRSEHSVLLRKADDFMEAMFARHRVIEPDERDSEREKDTPKPKRVVKRESAARLQPLPRPPQVPEPVHDEPSLVIEKLTVEVVAPPTQPLKPQRQVVIVREAGNRRRAVPSSQRFGLNHF